jgi:glycosyltransferase involved in cell wall biosynthesis
VKVLCLSHSSVLPTYQDKIGHLARQRGIEPTLFLPHRWVEAGRLVEVHDSATGYPVRILRVWMGGRLKWHFYPSFAREAYGMVPDLIHAEEEPYSFAAWQAARVARCLQVPFVFFTWENLLEHFGLIHQRIRAEVLSIARFAIAGNREAVDLLERAGFPRERTAVIPQYGVDPDLFRRRASPGLKKSLRLGPFTVGYVGRWVREKGLMDLLGAFARMKNKRATLLWVGGGP